MMISKLLLAGLLLLTSTQLLARGLKARAELMKYVIEQESKMPHETEWKVSWFEGINLIEEAQAYRQGETCLVLGFKSQFTNGMCRLSKAEGIKNYKKQCSSGSLPCNPKIFGKPSSDKPFCVAQNSGKDLSNYCAQETFKHLSKKAKTLTLEPDAKKVIEDIDKMTAKTFDLNKLDLSKIDGPLSQAIDSIFSEADSSLEAATSFTKDLCEDLKQSTDSGLQPLDLKTCQSYLTVLEKGKTPPVVTSKNIAMISTIDSISVRQPASISNEAEVCEAPILDTNVDANIKEVQKVVKYNDAQNWTTCMNKLEEHKKVASHLKDWAEMQTEIKRNLGYWHTLGKEKNFGILCDVDKQTGPKTFVFMSQSGFKQVNTPRNLVKGVENVSKISFEGKTYFIILDMLGDYFELFSPDNIKTANKTTQDAVAKYERSASATTNKVASIAIEDSQAAQACVKGRMVEYMDWITYPMGDLPSVAAYNKDILIYNKNPKDAGLRAKYSRTVEEIKKEKFLQMQDVPDCSGILTEEDFDKNFDSSYKDSVELYEKFRDYLGFPKS